MSEIITYESLYELLRNEKSEKDLQKIDPNFFQAVIIKIHRYRSGGENDDYQGFPDAGFDGGQGGKIFHRRNQHDDYGKAEPQSGQQTVINVFQRIFSEGGGRAPGEGSQQGKNSHHGCSIAEIYGTWVFESYKISANQRQESVDIKFGRKAFP